MDFDHLAGVGEPSRSRGRLDRLAPQADGVESVLQSKDAIRVQPDRPCTPGRDRVGGGPAEAAVELRQEPGQDCVGAGPIGRAGQAQLQREPILQRPP